jgi:hypothetical protein
MDNQSSSPEIIFPNVPDDFCPVGNWSEVFQQFIDTVLANGSINVPGLGDVTPAEIASINAELNSQQLQINSLDIRVDALEIGSKTITRTGTTSVGVGNSTLNITFAALPNANYGIAIVPIGLPTPSANAGSYVVQAGQTATGFNILVQDNPATISSLRWTAIHTS